MTGSLTIKNGKYYAILNVYENGKRKKKWICSGLPEKGNKRRAEQFLREKIAEHERMEGIVRSDVLFLIMFVFGWSRSHELLTRSLCKDILIRLNRMCCRTLIT